MTHRSGTFTDTTPPHYSKDPAASTAHEKIMSDLCLMNDEQLLIVDDSTLIINHLKGMLEDIEGIRIIGEAHSVAEALECISHTSLPDIVLLDINLPDINGIQFLRYLRAHHPSVKVIIISNQGGVFYRDLCLSIGASHYVDKSTEFELIPSLVSGLRSDNA